jgi:hypothetical protein
VRTNRPPAAAQGSAGAGNTRRAARPMAGMVRKSLESRPPADLRRGSGAAPKRTGRLTLDQRRYGEAVLNRQLDLWNAQV